MGIDDADDDVFEPERADGTGSCFAGGFAGERYRDGGVARTGRRHFQRRKLHDQRGPAGTDDQRHRADVHRSGEHGVPADGDGDELYQCFDGDVGNDGADDDVCEPDAIDGAGDCGAGGRAGECFGDGGDACAGRRTSNANTFAIDALSPTISGIAPTSATVGSSAFTLTVSGTGFTNTSTVMWGSTALTTTHVSATELTVQVMAAQVAAQGTASVTVVTPAPGGGTSNANTFEIDALAPTISGILPVFAGVGSAAFPLTVDGAGFTNSSTVMWGSTALATTYVSATRLTAQVTAPLVATQGNVSVTVETPAPGGGTSNASTFSIVVPAPVPSMSGIAPVMAVAGNAAFTLTVDGTNFDGTSKAMWGTTALTTTYVSPTEVTAQVTAAEIATAGEIPVTVMTPAPGGGTSNAYTFEIDTAGSTAPTFTTTTVTLTAGAAGTASYPVTLPSTATNVSVTCLNLPAGAICSYAGGALTITTTAATPAGTYSITAVFAETLPGAAAGLILLPFLLMPFGGTKKRKRAGMVLAALAGLVIAVALVGGGCGGGGGGSYTPPAPTTHSATSSGTVTLVVH